MVSHRPDLPGRLVLAGAFPLAAPCAAIADRRRVGHAAARRRRRQVFVPPRRHRRSCRVSLAAVHAAPGKRTAYGAPNW
ncbi:hypothetical protein E2562_025849 [Oryza meyeriana var. granulata]|uniref:Uncharacterized protein n=1 Tax=Oryza meyeriana var. granulata TaxID=110450 RepID=A0A6G1E1T1_9ORYZ|nr:hypothetical protein E2562_025849 [Oryza meyeriana var. granulata]